MLHCVIAIARVVDDNQFRKYIKRSSIASDVVRVYRPHFQDLCIKVPFASALLATRLLFCCRFFSLWTYLCSLIMTKYSHYKKAVELTPLVSEQYFRIMSAVPVLSHLTGAQMAAVSSLMYSQKLYGFNQACVEIDLL